jgi:hypothetical protein
MFVQIVRDQNKDWFCDYTTETQLWYPSSASASLHSCCVNSYHPYVLLWTATQKVAVDVRHTMLCFTSNISMRMPVLVLVWMVCSIGNTSNDKEYSNNGSHATNDEYANGMLLSPITE